MRHSKLPWRVDEDWRIDGADQIIDATGLTICFMATPIYAHDDDGKFIIDACNNYETLQSEVATLCEERNERLKECIDKINEVIELKAQRDNWIVKCDALQARLEEEQEDNIGLLKSVARLTADRDKLKNENNEIGYQALNYSYLINQKNIKIRALNLELAEAQEVIKKLLHYLPDSEHNNGDESWRYCWDELSDRAQDAVTNIRAEAQVFLDTGGMR